jgi:hypothetical protein
MKWNEMKWVSPFRIIAISLSMEVLICLHMVSIESFKRDKSSKVSLDNQEIIDN